MTSMETSLEIAYRDQEGCPNHEGQSFSKSTGDCSCGSRHHKGDLANARLRAGLCPDCGGPMRKYYVPNSNDPGDVEPAADCLNPACGWGY